MRALLVKSGTHRKVHALAIGKDIPIYQDELFSNIEYEQKCRINIHIEFLSNRRFPVENKSISEQLKGYGNLYELKPKPFRLFFFMMGNDAIIIHGFVKKKNNTDTSEIKRAVSLRDRFIKGEG
jgi:phage-related protein